MNKALSEMTLEELWQLFPIRLVDHNSLWQEWFNEEKACLSSILPSAVKIHHIGSTTIPNIKAKPIIDILVEAKIEDFANIHDILVNNGFICMNKQSTRISFNKGYTEKGYAMKVLHLHLREFGDHDELFFRDYLIEHPDVAMAYENLKISLSKDYEFDRDCYTKMKTSFVDKYTKLAKQLYGSEKYHK